MTTMLLGTTLMLGPSLGSIKMFLSCRWKAEGGRCLVLRKGGSATGVTSSLTTSL